MTEPNTNRAPYEEDDSMSQSTSASPQMPAVGTQAFLQWQSQVIGAAVAQAMHAIPPPRVVVNVPPAASVPASAPAPAAVPISGIQFKFGADPRQFTGSPEDARGYITQIDDRLNLSLAPPMTDKDKVMYFSSYLALGAPQRWHSSIVNTKPGLLSDYAAYVEEFKHHFVDPHEATTYRRKLENLRQDKDVQRYAAAFKEYAALAKVDDETKYLWFFRGLKLNIQRSLNSGSGAPTDFDTMVTSALNIDNFNKLVDNIHSTSSPNKGSRPSSNTTSTNAPPPAVPTTSSSSGPWPMEIDEVKSRLVHGHITSEERERRKKEGLCLYCASPDHHVHSCPRRSQKPQKAAPTPSKSGKAPPRT